MRLGTIARVGAGLLAAACLMALASPQTRTEAQESPPDERPNIILISTDDQTTYDMQWMPITRELIGGHGVDFPDGLSPHSLCCPARAEMVTGQYGQNNGVHHNTGANGGYHALIDRDNTIGRWLQDAGYHTGMAGKYMNGYNETYGAPEGWDHWNPYVRGTDFMNTRYYNDGDLVERHGYVDDITNEYVRSYIDEFAKAEQPFFVWISNYAPHRAKKRTGETEYSVPAPRFRGTLADVRLPALDKPSFNEDDVSDQPSNTHVAKVSPAEMQKRFTSRIEALQAADENVAKLVDQLDRLGELDNTYIFFVSDNGYLLGEHRLSHKNYIYRESMAVPFEVRVPTATTGTTSQMPVTLADLAPTISELAGATPERLVDGVSFAPLLRGQPMTWRDTQLIQTGKASPSLEGWRIRGARTDRYTYGVDVTDNFEQLYDRLRDPFEIDNVAKDPRYRPVLLDMRNRMEALRDCAGASCAQNFGPSVDPN
ncbi:sulfatase [Nocardioides sp.]|uniref:sulfatase family protein n=1 Tax=Nocardioides sp. TaxID=35761 RepID=UPI00352790C2